MKAYKLFKVRKDGSVGSLFINARARYPLGMWLPALQGIRKRGFAYRPGWHATAKPEAPHLSMKGRRWYEVEISDFVPIQRPDLQGGLWYLAQRIKIVRAI